MEQHIYNNMLQANSLQISPAVNYRYQSNSKPSGPFDCDSQNSKGQKETDILLRGEE